jgi:hypothetical protein
MVSGAYLFHDFEVIVTLVKNKLKFRKGSTDESSDSEQDKVE